MNGYKILEGCDAIRSSPAQIYHGIQTIKNCIVDLRFIPFDDAVQTHPDCLDPINDLLETAFYPYDLTKNQSGTIAQ